jgi:hypothetical protein
MSTILKVLAVLAIVAAAGVVVGILVTGGRTEIPIQSSSSNSPAPAGAKAEVRLPRRPAATAVVPRPVPAVAPATPNTTNVVVAFEPPPSETITNWEDRLDAVLGSNSQESEKVHQLLAMFPLLSEDGQVEVAQHLSNLVPDEEYASFGGYLTNPAIPESVLDILLSDALNRPNALKLPLLLEVARDPQNPKSGEAKDLLELYLEEDYGNDWDQWRAKTEQWLKDNPD